PVLAAGQGLSVGSRQSRQRTLASGDPWVPLRIPAAVDPAPRPIQRSPPTHQIKATRCLGVRPTVDTPGSAQGSRRRSSQLNAGGNLGRDLPTTGQASSSFSNSPSTAIPWRIFSSGTVTNDRRRALERGSLAKNGMPGTKATLRSIALPS